MPPSWSQKKRDENRGEGHTQKPDVDNLAKALLDAIYADDSHINDIRIKKIWGDEGAIEIVKP
jgi:Holliday junction resolvase RusA-like endonuclease